MENSFAETGTRFVENPINANQLLLPEDVNTINMIFNHHVLPHSLFNSPKNRLHNLCNPLYTKLAGL